MSSHVLSLQNFPPLQTANTTAQTQNLTPTVDRDCSQGANGANPGGLHIVEGVAQVPEELINKGRNIWKDYVVGFFLEQKLPYPVVREFLRKKWKTKGDYEMVADANLFYFKFTNEEDMRKVLEMAQIYMVGKCFIVTQWNQDVEKRKNTVKAIPIWVNLYNVPKDL
ncbi:hypothetical protein IFM89_029319 [Coptis chinensis]|uniref:DUF4283 domain-containing protein n=1 Tax=Coptis chinensis TaxID=261450 RepID=A0A835IQG6_9MAGN|nr:hypothetical protein IFM89_029319 [Coptis chinensis]